jgi:hypothetical protein
LREIASATVLAALDLCAERASEWVPLRQVEERAGREPAQARADLAVLTMTVKRQFGRSNWPFTAQWRAGDEQVCYSMSHQVAALWKELSEPPAEVAVSTDRGDGQPSS